MKEKGITKLAVLSSNDGFGAAGKKQLEDLAKTGRHRNSAQRGL